METIKSKKGNVAWRVIKKEIRPSGKQTKSHFTVACSICGHEITAQKIHIQNRVKCPGCSSKPAALKTDETGNCIAICDIGMVEFIRDHQDKHGVSERAAVRHFIETAKNHVVADDPILEGITEESVNAKVRRLTGKKKDKIQNCGEPPQKDNDIKNGSKKEKSQKAHWNVVERKLSALVDYIKGNCQCNSGNVTRELSVKIIDRIGYLKTIESHYLEGENEQKSSILTNFQKG